MPDRCYVPNCRSGYPDYPKSKGKFTMFKPPTDPLLLKRWNQLIPREDSTLKPSSRVCSHHFEENDVIKGRWIIMENEKKVFFPWVNWKLQEGAIPRLFPNCPDHLSKPTGNKRKLPTERKSVPTKRRKKNSNPEFSGRVDDLPEDWEGVNVVGHVESNDPWALFDPQNCEVPPAWYWIQSKDEIQVPLCVQFQIIAGKSVTSKSLHFKDGSAFLCVDGNIIGSTILHPGDEQESLSQQLVKVIKDFDSSKICPGVLDDKFSSIKSCAGAVSDNGNWRSIKCPTIYNDNGKSCCSECYTVKRALGRIRSKIPTQTEAEKLEKLRFEYRMAKQKLDRKEDKLAEMEKTIITMEAQEYILKLEKASKYKDFWIHKAIYFNVTELNIVIINNSPVFTVRNEKKKKKFPSVTAMVLTLP